VVFINEIHYDNTVLTLVKELKSLNCWNGFDRMEYYSYNGNGGVSYTPGTLSGIIPNQSNGFGTVFVSINGLQNGVLMVLH
jgi:hypothetical protein